MPSLNRISSTPLSSTLWLGPGLSGKSFKSFITEECLNSNYNYKINLSNVLMERKKRKKYVAFIKHILKKFNAYTVNHLINLLAQMLETKRLYLSVCGCGCVEDAGVWSSLCIALAHHVWDLLPAVWQHHCPEPGFERWLAVRVGVCLGWGRGELYIGGLIKINFLASWKPQWGDLCLVRQKALAVLTNKQLDTFRWTMPQGETITFTLHTLNSINTEATAETLSWYLHSWLTLTHQQINVWFL